MPKVYNIHSGEVPTNAVPIMRPSVFGNPFVIGKDGDRDQVCEKYELWLEERPKLKKAIKMVLKGKDLVCCCKPARCHGDTLLRIANEGDIVEGRY